MSGHACQEELKLIHALTDPRFFIPVHGEYRHLHHHANLALSMGMDEDHVRIVDTGEIVEISPNRLSVVGSVPSGEVLIDGLGVGDVGAVVLRDRKHLSQDGLLVVIMAVEHEKRHVVSGPDIISRGFVYMREADQLVEGTRSAARSVAAVLRPHRSQRLEPGEEPTCGTPCKNTFTTRSSVRHDLAGHRGGLNRSGILRVKALREECCHERLRSGPSVGPLPAGV